MAFYYKNAKGYKARLRLRRKKIDYRFCEECNVERMMYPHLGFYVRLSCSVCGDDIFVIGYNESTFIHKRRKCIYKRDEYFQSKIRKLLCQEPLKIPDSVIRLLEADQSYTNLITYCIITLRWTRQRYQYYKTTIEKE